MTSTAKPPTGGRSGTTAARAARIAAAKAERERKAKAAKVRNLTFAIAAAVVLAVVAVVVIPRLGSGAAKPGAIPLGLTTYQGATGSLYGENAAPVTITLFEDLQCPVCRRLEKTNGAEIDSLVESHKIRVVYSIVSFLDSSSNGNKYSSRAANAYYCTPQSQRKALHDAFYKNQPGEDTNGRTDAQILAVAKSAGVNPTDLASCMKSHLYEGYATGHQVQVLDKLSGAIGTPTMLVNGKVYAGVLTLTPSILDQIVAQVSS